MDGLSKQVENLEIRYKEDLNKKPIEVDKTMIDEESEQPKANDQGQAEPANLESINDNSTNSDATDGASTSDDLNEKTETDKKDEENGSSTSEVDSKKIDSSCDNNESHEKEASDHFEKKQSVERVQLEKLSKDLNCTARSEEAPEEEHSTKNAQ